MRREYSQFYSTTSRKDIFVENRALAGRPRHGHRHCHSVFRSWSFARSFARPVALLEFLPRATRAWVVAADFGAAADDLLYRGHFGAATGHFRLLEFTLFLRWNSCSISSTDVETLRGRLPLAEGRDGRS